MTAPIAGPDDHRGRRARGGRASGAGLEVQRVHRSRRPRRAPMRRLARNPVQRVRQADLGRGRPASVHYRVGWPPADHRPELRTHANPGRHRPDPGISASDTTWLLLFEALPERTTDRSPDDFRAIGRTLATMHEVHQGQFGLADFDGYFGPLPQDNRPVPANTWPDFYAERRVRPLLKIAVDSGNLPAELTRRRRTRHRPTARPRTTRERGRACCTATPSRTTSCAHPTARPSPGRS